MKDRDSNTHASGCAGILMLAVAAVLATSDSTLAQNAAQQGEANQDVAVQADEATVEAGRQIWLNSGCAGCHGNQGQGGTSPDLPPGPSLRATGLDRNGLIEVIGCGVTGTQMAAWLRGAYTEKSCYGAELGQAPARTMVIGMFDADELGTLVDYIMVEMVGK